MSDHSTAGVTENAALNGSQILTSEKIETVLSDFRSWLHQATTQVPENAAQTQPAPINLFTLISNFVAMRHEINLQTKAVRGQQEQVGQALSQLKQTLEMAEKAQAESRQAAQAQENERLRPLLRSLVDAADLMRLARREVEKVRSLIWPILEQISDAVQKIDLPPLNLPESPTQTILELPSPASQLGSVDVPEVEVQLPSGPTVSSAPARKGFFSRLFSRAEPTTAPALPGPMDISAVKDALQLHRDKTRAVVDRHNESANNVLKAYHDKVAEVVAADREAQSEILSRQQEQTQESLDQHNQRVLQAIQEQRDATDSSIDRVVKMLDSVVAGYTMSLQRLERTFRAFELEQIPTEGTPFDPEKMEAIEATPNSGRPSGEVLEEVRPGYFWRGRVFRYAQVRVARG